MSVLERAIGAALDLVFPPQCALCRRTGAILCDGCAGALPRADGRRCARCWGTVRDGALCRYCADAPPRYASLRSTCVMDAGARQLVHELKYGGMAALAAPMAGLMVAALDVDGVDLVVPVPLHESRERSRGFNQADALARRIAQRLALQYERRGARRTRATAPQVKTMSREARLENVAGAFSARPGAVEGQRVLLIDDVATTGATLDACASALLAAGATSVRCATFARAH